jgi:DNA-binding MarR family transcriptional regulator
MTNDLERSLPFLMHLIVSQIETEVNKHARAYGLKIEGVRVLFRLLAKDHLTVNELARLTGIETSTLSRLLDRMSAKGLLKRSRDTNDKRSVLLSLTPKGRKLALQHRPVYYRDYDKVLLAGFDQQEGAAFRQALMRMLDNLRDIKVDFAKASVTKTVATPVAAAAMRGQKTARRATG